MTEFEQQSHLVPRTLWEKLYLGWVLICFFMVWIGTWAVNEPVAVLGMPLVYVWCTSWGFVWLFGCMYFGLKIEAAAAEAKGE